MIRICAILLLSVSLTPAGAAASDLAPLQSLQAWLDGTERLEADFEQELESGALGAGLIESGKLYLERPGRMRWEYLDPDHKVALFRGPDMELYLEEEAQLIRTPIPAEGDLLPLLLAGTGRIAELFEGELIDDHPGAARVRLIPRRDSETLEVLTVTLRKPSFSITSIEVQDAAGNLTAYRFDSLRRNRKLPRGIFSFEVPPGTEVIDQP